MRTKSVPLSGPVIKEKANQLARDQDDVSIQKPPAADVRKAIQCLRDFSLCTQMDSALLDNITVIERQLNNAIGAQARQKKITDLF